MELCQTPSPHVYSCLSHPKEQGAFLTWLTTAVLEVMPCSTLKFT